MALSDMQVLNESQDGWLSTILYQRWTGSYAVAVFDNQHRCFVSTIIVCPAGIRQAHVYFELYCKGQYRNFSAWR